ncbi:MAG: hypothetical protein ACOYMN_18225 [Roseimicrobium sp.]
MTDEDRGDLEIRHALLVMKHVKLLEIISQHGHGYKVALGNYTPEQKKSIRGDINALASILTFCPPELLCNVCKFHEKYDDDEALFLSFESHFDAAFEWVEACIEVGGLRAGKRARKQSWWERFVRWFTT